MPSSCTGEVVARAGRRRVTVAVMGKAAVKRAKSAVSMVIRRSVGAPWTTARALHNPRGGSDLRRHMGRLAGPKKKEAGSWGLKKVTGLAPS